MGLANADGFPNAHRFTAQSNAQAVRRFVEVFGPLIWTAEAGNRIDIARCSLKKQTIRARKTFYHAGHLSGKPGGNSALLRSLCNGMRRKINQTGDGISLYIFNPRNADLAVNRPVVVVAENNPPIRGLLPAVDTDIGTAPADTHSRWLQILLCLLYQARQFESEMNPIGIDQLRGFGWTRTR